MLSARNPDAPALPVADRQLIEQISHGVDSIPDLCAASGVTATAVRQRLVRLEASGYLEKQSVRVGRGRPRNAYRVTETGYRQLGSKADDLAVALWSAVAGTEEPELRDRLLMRLRDALRERYGRGVTSTELPERIRQLGHSLSEQGYPVEVVDDPVSLPVLRETHCPYREIATQDAGICELERAVYSDVLGAPVELTACCRDGESCCQFEIAGVAGS
ncbi:MAG: helix-turn-helix transcriptional regulator [Planctomycetaceae bacterium]